MGQKTHILRTNKKSVKVVIPIITQQSSEIYITGYDPLSPKTEYFSRKLVVNGLDRVQLNCPQSPRKLKIIIWNNDGVKFTVPTIEVTPLTATRNFTEDENNDIRLIENFSRKAGRLPSRRYYTIKGAKFKIQYLPVIRRDDGTEHPTPARIHTKLPLIQVSKKHFDKMTVPQRVAILLHEYSHNFVNMDQDNEFESDANMVAIYEELGYPKIEAVYAFTNIMNDTNVNVNRVKNIINKL